MSHRRVRVLSWPTLKTQLNTDLEPTRSSILALSVHYLSRVHNRNEGEYQTPIVPSHVLEICTGAGYLLANVYFISEGMRSHITLALMFSMNS